MATSTTFLALVKAAVSEKYSVAVTNGNLDKIDAGVKALDTEVTANKVLFDKIKITRANSVTNNSAYDCRGSLFIKVATSATTGIIIADIRIKAKVGVTLPDIDAVNTALVTPAGYKPKIGQNTALATIAGAGFNSSGQLNWDDTGGVTIRRNGTISASFPVNTVLGCVLVAEWDGSAT